MPIQVRLIVANSGHCAWLKSVLGRDPRFTVISDDPNVDDGRSADLFVVDLAHPLASRPRLWVIIHLRYAEARLIAVAERPFDEAALEAALHAGVSQFLEWADPSANFPDLALAAYEGRFRIAPWVFNAAAALLRRLNQDEPCVQIGGLRLEAGKHEVRLEDRCLALTPLEYKTLAYLARNAGRAVAPSELLREVWECRLQPRGSQLAVKKVIRRLRQKIEPDSKQPRYVQTVRGYGYFVPKLGPNVNVWPRDFGYTTLGN